MKEKNIMILQCPINSLGYGVAGYNIAKQLVKSGEDVAIFPIGDPEPELYQDLQKYDWRIKNILDCRNKTTSIKIWHQNQLHERVGNGTQIGFPIFELNKFTLQEKRSMMFCDKIFVCSKWAKGVIQDQISITDEMIDVVPLGVDRSIFNENNNVARKPTVFFNCGKWEIRKGHDVLLKCFEAAFTKDDDVELWLLCENPFINQINEQWNNYYKNSKLANKIKILPRQKSHQNVYNIMRQIDCGVFPVKAEGWNLELLELLSCGKHVITTNYSGHTEFTNTENSYLIEIDKLEPAHDGIWFHGQGEWAAFEDRQIEQTANYMREIHNKKVNNQLQNNLAGIETAIKFSWENTAKEILNGL
jgi:glycosyltransferase involved in cell wall biosynthesis